MIHPPHPESQPTLEADRPRRPGRFFRQTLIIGGLCTLAACSGMGTPSDSAPERGVEPLDRFEDTDSPWSAPVLSRSISVRDGKTGADYSFAELVQRLAQADVVFLGETHLDETTHRLEDAVLAGIAARKQGRVVLSLEMFERDTQASLDAYLAGQIDEAEFLASSRPWGNYSTAYRRMIERAKREGLSVVAANFPAPLRRRVGMEGEEALRTLSPEERALLPEEFLPNRPQYWRRVDNAVRGHLAMMGGPKDPGDPRLFAGQSLWDNAMGDACAQALRDHPEHTVLHVNGGFHTLYWDGTVHQLRLRAPEAEVLTVDIVPVANPQTASLGGTPAADFVVFVEARASDERDGFHAVRFGRDLRYILHVPEGASDEHPVPLLIWLGDTGATPSEGLALWRASLGEECAIAVVEAPYRELQEDAVEAGRWSWPDTFLEDMGALANGLEEMRGYLGRNLPIDVERTLIAGEGTGGTVAVAAVLRAGSLPTTGFAFAPRKFSKLSDMPLPLAEFAGEDGPLPRSVQVEVQGEDREWWQGELAQHNAVGISTALVPPAKDPWETDAVRARKVRALLGLPPATPQGERSERFHIATRPRRAARWARIRAAQDPTLQLAVLDERPEGSSSQPFSTDLSGEDLEATPPPPCPGPFGGTTVLVLPEGLNEDQQAAWFALEENDPLAAKSRFHRLRVATEQGERGLARVLEALLEQHRSNALVVPAQFCASIETMRRLRAEVEPLNDSMTLHWLPGLGGPRD